MNRLPPHARGLKIGLFGGTFDPPHQAHLAACLLAMKRLGLDQVWWLVTPGNPLKDTRNLAPLRTRIAAARKLAHHPRIHVSGLEAEIGTRYTFDTIAYLRARCPGVHFVWIMGADNLRSFHRWQKWRGIANMIPIAVVDRLGPSLYAAQGRPVRRSRGPGFPRAGRAQTAAPQAAGLGLPARAEVAAVLDRVAGASGGHERDTAPQIFVADGAFERLKPLTPRAYLMSCAPGSRPRQSRKEGTLITTDVSTSTASASKLAGECLSRTCPALPAAA